MKYFLYLDKKHWDRIVLQLTILCFKGRIYQLNVFSPYDTILDGFCELHLRISGLL